MNRRSLVSRILALPATVALSACSRASQPTAGSQNKGKSATGFAPLTVPPPDWKSLLPAERYRILFEEATERAGSSPLDAEHRPGTFICAACYLPMFESKHKFDSGTGWPSFTQPIAGHMNSKTDYKLLLPRTEYHCARCTGHQGHVFKDGPPPRGERWCNNGLALQFVPAGEALPELRE